LVFFFLDVHFNSLWKLEKCLNYIDGVIYNIEQSIIENNPEDELKIKLNKNTP
jgi:hypothetical protein